MKSVIFLIICISLLNAGDAYGQEAKGNIDQGKSNPVMLSAAPELAGLMETWRSEFMIDNPGMVVNLGPLRQDINRISGLAFVTDDEIEKISRESEWRMIVGRDVIVPFTSADNPAINDLYKRGVSSEKLAGLFVENDMQGSPMLADNEQKGPAHLYMTRDNSIRSFVSEFLNADPDRLKATFVESTAALLSEIRKDPTGIGFCRMTDITDPGKQEFFSDVRLVPLDVNNNGQLDYFEQIYGDLSTFTRGVYIGKYPKALFSNIFSVSVSQPVDATELAFLKWILTDGQQFLGKNGYAELVPGEIQSKTSTLFESQADIIEAHGNPSSLRAIFLLLVTFIIAASLIYAVLRYVRGYKKETPVAERTRATVFNEKSLIVPKGLFFDKTHTWAFMENDGTVKVGIDDFLQHITGNITRIKMKSPGEQIIKGEPVISMIQNGKQISIKSPVSGMITGRNEELCRDSSVINTSPYANGWIYKIEPENWMKETRFMFMAEKYIEWIRDEFTRLKDFLAMALRSNELKLSQIVLQDGGEIKEGLLEDFGPEVWEDFQTQFIDATR